MVLVSLPLLLQVPSVEAAAFSFTGSVTAHFTPSASLGGVTATHNSITGSVTITFSASNSVTNGMSSTTSTGSGTITTYITTTITGWLAPDSVHFAHSLVFMTVPLGVMVMSTMLFRFFKRKGDIGVYVGLGSFTGGCILADLSSNGLNPSAVPFAAVIVGGVLIFLWWWNS